MENTIELLYGGVHDVRVEEMTKNLLILGSQHSSLLARLFVTLHEQHPKSIELNKFDAFISMAIAITNEHGITAFPILQKNWIELK